MDLSKVKEIITPRGSLNKILRSGVTIWSKNTDLQYTIWKNGALIKRVTMPQFVKEIQNGTARTDYGIGAQIYIPYTDPWTGGNYDLPFNFGTFTSYPGKLGLQAHYAIPTKACAYRYAVSDTWGSSYIKKWFNSSGYATLNFGSSSVGEQSMKGLLSCLPEDFVETMQTITTGSDDTQCKVFLLTATQYCASTADYDNGETTNAKKVTATCTYPEKEGQVWEYWRNKIGTLQAYETTNSNRIVHAIGRGISRGAVPSPDSQPAINFVTLSHHSYKNKSGTSQFIYVFSLAGRYYGNGAARTSASFQYQPACVIG